MGKYLYNLLSKIIRSIVEMDVRHRLILYDERQAEIVRLWQKSIDTMIEQQTIIKRLATKEEIIVRRQDLLEATTREILEMLEGEIDSLVEKISEFENDSNGFHDKVTQIRIDGIKREIISLAKRQSILKQQHAISGLNTNPDILIELDNIEENIQTAQIELDVLRGKSDVSI